MDVGTAEGTGLIADPDGASARLPRRYVQLVRKMTPCSSARATGSGETLMFIEEQGGVHHESAWARRLPAALRFLLGK